MICKAEEFTSSFFSAVKGSRRFVNDTQSINKRYKYANKQSPPFN